MIFTNSIYLQYWLDLEKPVCRQVGLSLIDPILRFCVKFYTPDPAQLEEEFTRYLFCLQIKRDLAQGLLQCNDNTAALMASYIVQGNNNSFQNYINENKLKSRIVLRQMIDYFSRVWRLCDRGLSGSYVFVNL